MKYNYKCSLSLSLSLSLYIYIYIYIERERERERFRIYCSKFMINSKIIKKNNRLVFPKEYSCKRKIRNAQLHAFKPQMACYFIMRLYQRYKIICVARSKHIHFSNKLSLSSATFWLNETKTPLFLQQAFQNLRHVPYAFQ